MVAVDDNVLTARLDVDPELLAPNDLHAATVIGLADTSCGYGARLALPDGASGFTTVELKANFIVWPSRAGWRAARGWCTAAERRRCGTRR